MTSEGGGHPTIKLLLSGCVYLIALVTFLALGIGIMPPDVVRRVTDSILFPGVAVIIVVGSLLWAVRMRRTRAQKEGERSPESSLPIDPT